MERPRARILVVEDDPAILGGLLDVLVFNGYDAQGAADGGEGLDKALAEPWELIILDVMLPTTDGFTICKTVRRKKPRQGIVMLTAKGSEEDVVTGFRSGADDYIAKPFSLRELMVRVEAVLRRAGATAGDAEVTVCGITFAGQTLTARCGDRQVEITRREMEIVAYLDQHRERIVSKKDLLTDVWKYRDADIETRTVDIHVLKLRKKLAQLVGERPVIVTIRGEGYRICPGAA